MEIIASIICIAILTYSAVLEKFVVGKHNYMHFSLARIFYMLAITIVFIVVYDPKVLSSKAFYVSLKDVNVILVGTLTAVAMILYFWLLTTKDLYIMSMIWPSVMVLSIIACFFVIKEKINWIQWFGIVITFVGISVTLLNQK